MKPQRLALHCYRICFGGAYQIGEDFIGVSTERIDLWAFSAADAKVQAQTMPKPFYWSNIAIKPWIRLRDL